MYHDSKYPGYNDKLQLQISTDGLTWSNVGLAVSRYNVTNGWVQVAVDLSSYIGQGSLRLGFLGFSENGNDIYFDDVVITADCPLNLIFASTTTPAGTGYVTIANNTTIPPTIDMCNDTLNPCQNIYPYGAQLVMTAYTNVDSLLSSWSGACSGNGTCNVTMNDAQAVTAIFSYVQPARIDGAIPQYFSSLHDAYKAALSGQTIQTRAFTFVENLNLVEPKEVTIKGGYDTYYATQIGYTLLHGLLTVGNGKLLTERLEIK
jgi:hypothetical protein